MKIMLEPVFTEKCGLTGVFSKNRKYPAARMLHEAQKFLEHRGQHSHGIATYNDDLYCEVRTGHVMHDLRERQYQNLKGSSGIGHNRYKTAGADGKVYSQPFIEEAEWGKFALAHNGTIWNAPALAARLFSDDANFRTGKDNGFFDINRVSDSEVIAKLISTGKNLIDGIIYASTQLIGAYCLTILDDNGEVYGVRDPRGIKPLCRGKGNETVGIFSENCVFESGMLEMEFDDYIWPGDIYHVGWDGEEVITLPDKDKVPLARDIFEWVYFASPTSVIDGISVYLTRFNYGVALGRKSTPVKSDYVVVPVPLSGLSGAEGFAAETGLQRVTWMLRNRFAGRTFIGKDSVERKKIMESKLSRVHYAIEKYPDAYLIDDSIVRGDTTSRLVSWLKEAGAGEIHLRIGYPEVIDICPWGGIDMKSRNEHIANRYPNIQERIKKSIKSDSLIYNKPEDIIWAINNAKVDDAKNWDDLTLDDFCTHCITRRNPFEKVDGFKEKE